jgi:preprotein translocase subunit SecF
MTEKRSDYRKRQKKGLIDKVKSAFSNNDSEEVDVNPDFTKDKNEVENRRRPLTRDGQEFYQRDETIDKETVRENKSLKLKKRLNRAILLVVVLIVLVLLALFHL